MGLHGRLIEALRRQLPLTDFFETGTLEAATTTAFAPLFDRVWTVELSPLRWDRARQRLAHFGHVKSILGSSPDLLRALEPELSESSVLYWLDAHSFIATDGLPYPCPLLEEVAAIGRLNDRSVILIDQSHFFLGPPPESGNPAHWRGLHNLQAALRDISKEHGLWLLNGLLIYAPMRIAGDVTAYGHAHGADLPKPAQPARAEVEPGDAMPSREAPADARDSGHGLDWGFNRVLASQDRAERIFAFHAQRMGISRLLDIGSNSGQFAAKMRRFGYDGVIYSVEPQSAAHLELRKNAQSDVRWIPLSRQAAGRVHGKLDLNLSENSWSSSLLPVHENHLRAAPETRTVGRERVFVTKTADLLHEPLMRRIDALKIDVQGYELEVLEGLRSCIDGIQLILLEMSLVECYSGAPDLFILDRFLVEELGFERISFEPSYYDDRAGVVQQFDGIYSKTRRTGTSPAADGSHAFGAVVTSMHGVPSRVSRSGKELGKEWLGLCVASWTQFSQSVSSVSERSPPDARVRWIQTDARPSIAELFDAMPQDGNTHIVLCNADILVSEELMRLSAQLDPATVYLAHRVDVEFNEDNPELFDRGEMYEFGFDLFLLPPEFVRFVRDARALPREFLIGQPWWDYLVPLAALAGGFPVKRLPCNQALAMHHRHPVQYDRDRFTKLGEAFLSAVAGLASQFPNRRCDLLEDIARLSGPLDVRLAAICGIVCSRLP